MNDPYTQRNYGREIAFILFSQKWVAILSTLLVVAATFAVVYGVTPKYESVGTFLIKGKKSESDPGSLNQQTRVVDVTKADLYSEVEILTSAEVTERTALELIPKGLWRFIGIPETSSDGYLIDMLQGRLASRLTTTVVPSSNVVEARLRWTDPDEAELILSTLMKNYLEYRNSIFNPENVGDFFTEQVENYQRALNEKQRELMEIVNTTNAPDAEAEIRNNLELRATIERQLNELEAQRLELKAFAEQIEAALETKRVQYFGFINNDTIRGLGARLQDLAMKREQLRQLSRIRAPRADRSAEDTVLDDIEKARDNAMDEQVAALHAQLRTEVRTFLEDRKARLSGVEERVRALRNRLGQIRERNVELKKAQMRADWLRQETALLTESFKTFFQKREQANLMNSRGEGSFSHVVVLQQAEGNPTPVFPNPKRLIPLGMLAAVFTGISVAFLAFFFDHTVKRPEDVEAALGVPVLFSIGDQGGNWERKMSRFQAKAHHDAQGGGHGHGSVSVLWGAGGAVVALLVVLGLGLLAVRVADPELWSQVEYVVFGTEPEPVKTPSARTANAKPSARPDVPFRPNPPPAARMTEAPAPKPDPDPPATAVSPPPVTPAPSGPSIPAEPPETAAVSAMPDIPLALPKAAPDIDVPPPS